MALRDQGETDGTGGKVQAWRPAGHPLVSGEFPEGQLEVCLGAVRERNRSKTRDGSALSSPMPVSVTSRMPFPFSLHTWRFTVPQLKRLAPARTQ